MTKPWHDEATEYLRNGGVAPDWPKWLHAALAERCRLNSEKDLLQEDVARLCEALRLIAQLPQFPARDIARRALGVADEPAPRSTAELRKELEKRH